MNESDIRVMESIIKKRLKDVPDDYYIHDSGKVLYALFGGTYLWSMEAPEGKNFHAMNSVDIATLINQNLSEKLG
jgi:hypothetical protein